MFGLYTFIIVVNISASGSLFFFGKMALGPILTLAIFTTLQAAYIYVIMKTVKIETHSILCSTMTEELKYVFVRKACPDSDKSRRSCGDDMGKKTTAFKY